jgi:hypothetical protein
MSSRIVSRVDLAIEQLNIALSLFLKEQSLVASLTLAGAAEEVLARALEQHGKTTALQHWFCGESLNDSEVTWASFVARENRARNLAKHWGQLDEAQVAIDLREAAAFMLYRACTNFEWLGYKRTKGMRVFERWFWQWAA